MKNAIIILASFVGIFIGFISYTSESWDIFEPIISFISLTLGGATYLQTKKKKTSAVDNSDGELIIVLSTFDESRIAGVIEQTHREIGSVDCIISSMDLLGKSVLTDDEDYMVIMRELRKIAGKNRTKHIKIVIASSVGLGFLAGQVLQPNLYKSTIYVSGVGHKYVPLPTLTMGW